MIRGYAEADREAVYDVCVRTAAAGEDARGKYGSDELMGDLFAGPYLTFEPAHAFVLEDAGQVVGYVLGTASTPAFAQWYRATWMPCLDARYPPADPSFQERLEMDPGTTVRPESRAYPAHLHIDLLPAAQGQGWGRRLVDTFQTAVGVPVHLGVDPANTRARGFYERVGFELLLDTGHVLVLGRTGVHVPSSDPGPGRR